MSPYESFLAGHNFFNETVLSVNVFSQMFDSNLIVRIIASAIGFIADYVFVLLVLGVFMGVMALAIGFVVQLFKSLFDASL